MRKLFIIFICGILGLNTAVFAEDLPNITADGLAGIAEDSEYSVATVQKVFSEFEVLSETYMAEGDQYVRIVVENEGQRIAEFSDGIEGGFSSILILSPSISDENGIKVGMPASGLPQEILPSCVAGVDEHAEKLICNFKAIPNVQYWIGGNEMSAEGLKLTEKSYLFGIRWLPKSYF